ncbi:unnamed protein product, partial [Rotaria sp. Silwood1]
ENLNVIGTLEESYNDYVPIAETLLDTSDFGEQKLVNVGWSSKTIQFHGSAGKKTALENINIIPTKLKSDDDAGRSHIVWRDDGDLFAVSFISLKNQWRIIKIFNKQGQLQATNETSLNGYIESAM